LKKSKDKYKLRYLISQDKIFTQLCLLNLFIKFIFLFYQTTIKIDTHKIDWIKEKKNARLLYEDEYFLFSKIKLIYKKIKKIKNESK